jgi:hypothetical protein
MTRLVCMLLIAASLYTPASYGAHPDIVLKKTAGNAGGLVGLLLMAFGGAGGMVAQKLLDDNLDYIDRKNQEIDKQKKEEANRKADLEHKAIRADIRELDRKIADYNRQFDRARREVVLLEHQHRIIEYGNQIRANINEPKVQAILTDEAQAVLNAELRSIEYAGLVKLQPEAPSEPRYAQNFIVRYVETKAKVLSEFTDGLAKGFHKGFVTSVDVMKAIYEDPRLLAEVGRGAVHLLSHPEKVWKQAKGALLRYYDLAENGSAQEIGEAAGELIAEMAQSAVLPPGAGKVFNVGLLMASVKHSLKLRAHVLGPVIKPAILKLEHSPLRSDIDKVKKLVKAERNLTRDLKGHKIEGWEPSNDVNARFKKQFPEFKPPHQENTQVIDFRVRGNPKYNRVYTQGKQTGSWLLPEDAIKGLTPHQIQLKYSLPELPTHVCDVFPNEGTLITRSRVNHIQLDELLRELGEADAKDLSGAIQYQIQGARDKRWYTNERLLK